MRHTNIWLNANLTCTRSTAIVPQGRATPTLARRAGIFQVRIMAVLATVVLTLTFAQFTTVNAEETAKSLTSKATELSSQGKGKEALELLNKAIAADKAFAFAYYVRGRERFRLGQVERSVEDFDEYVKLEPDRESRQWERGISLYYAGQFARGAKQFEMYQTFEGNDVENAVWRYLCVAKIDGVEQAAKTLLPIENDRRIPMMHVYKMYRGLLKPDEVLTAAKQDNPPPDELDSRLFYVHLYLALFFDAAGDQEQAKKYIVLAADERLQKNRRLNPYMWDVARVHAERLTKKTTKAGKEEK